MLGKCCTQYGSKFGKLSSGHRTGKGQFSFQSQRKVIPKNAQTTAQLHSSQYSCLANPMDGGTWYAAVHGVSKSRTRLSDFTFTHWRRKWQPTPVFLPGESQRRGRLVGCCLYGRTESDTTEGSRDQIANIRWIIKKAREVQKNIYFCFIIMLKPLTVWITINCGKF